MQKKYFMVSFDNCTVNDMFVLKDQNGACWAVWIKLSDVVTVVQVMKCFFGFTAQLAIIFLSGSAFYILMRCLVWCVSKTFGVQSSTTVLVFAITSCCASSKSAGQEQVFNSDIYTIEELSDKRYGVWYLTLLGPDIFLRVVIC